MYKKLILSLSLMGTLSFGANYEEGIKFYESYNKTMNASDIQRSYDVFLQVGNSGDPRGYARIGDFYLHGVGTFSQSSKKSYDWFLKAANQGDMYSQNIVGTMHTNGLLYGYFAKQDYDVALNWFQKAANQGSIVAIENIAFVYEKKGDYEKAINWYEKSAKKGNKLAYNDIGMIYYNKLNDLKTSLKWFRKGCDSGDKQACENWKNVKSYGIN